MNEEIIELFRLASKFFFKKYKKTGGSQGQLAKEFGVTQTYLSSVMNGSRSASFELYNQIAEKLYGPLDKFITAGRNIKEGRDPLEADKHKEEDSIERLMAQLTYYIMDYKRLQKELSEQKIFYETIIENLQSGVVVMDKEDIVLFANKHMEKMSGIAPDKIIGTSPYDPQKHSRDTEMGFFAKEYKKARKLLIPVFYEKIPVKHPDEKVAYNSGWVIPLLKDNKFNGMICTLRDTTLTQTLSDLFIQSLQQCPDGIVVVQQDAGDDAPTAYFANRAFLEIFDLAELNPKPDSTPFLEVIEIMKKKIKNAAEWEEVEQDAFENKRDKASCTIKMKNGKKYEWESKLLINDLKKHIGRFATVSEV